MAHGLEHQLAQQHSGRDIEYNEAHTAKLPPTAHRFMPLQGDCTSMEYMDAYHVKHRMKYVLSPRSSVPFSMQMQSLHDFAREIESIYALSPAVHVVSEPR